MRRYHRDLLSKKFNLSINYLALNPDQQKRITSPYFNTFKQGDSNFGLGINKDNGKKDGNGGQDELEDIEDVMYDRDYQERLKYL